MRRTAALLAASALLLGACSTAVAGPAPVLPPEASLTPPASPPVPAAPLPAAPAQAPSSAAPSTPRAAATPTQEPVPATRTSKARHVPAYPRDGRQGRRVVYDKALMHVWIVDGRDRVVRHYPVTGRWDRPLKGTYRIYSKSRVATNVESQASFGWMVRFAHGPRTGAPIGFHAIPIFYADTERGAAGTRMSRLSDLGLPVATGGCVRQKDADAAFLYGWARVGDLVVVLPYP